MATANGYIGRFAPSPTGPLHFGSLVAAVGSYLAARKADGKWHVRIDDLDREREVPGAADAILRTLTAFGFEWDGPIVYQNHRAAAYSFALERLRRDGRVYECSCSRSEIEAATRPPAVEYPYPGTCRDGARHPERATATRFRTMPGEVGFVDALQGLVTQDVNAATGDFVLRRRDGYFAYQLAVVVDDADLGVTEVVRGADLLGNTPRQIALQQALGFPSPGYAHLPLAVDRTGAKLSKSSQSVAVDPAKPGEGLWKTLDFLKQSPPVALKGAPLNELWPWALAHWSLWPLRGLLTLPAPAP